MFVIKVRSHQREELVEFTSEVQQKLTESKAVESLFAYLSLVVAVIRPAAGREHGSEPSGSRRLREAPSRRSK